MGWVKEPKCKKLKEIKKLVEKLREVQIKDNEQKLKGLLNAVEAKRAAANASK